MSRELPPIDVRIDRLAAQVEALLLTDSAGRKTRLHERLRQGIAGASD